MEKRVFDLEMRLLRFAVQVCEVAEKLSSSGFTGKHVANQLVRSGTSPAPNYGEAQSAESRRDFIHKMKICLKELRETHVWLQFIQLKGMADTDLVNGAESEANELISIFVKSIETAQSNLNRK